MKKVNAQVLFNALTASQINKEVKELLQLDLSDKLLELLKYMETEKLLMVRDLIQIVGVSGVGTFTELKDLAENQHYQAQKREILYDFNGGMIDRPIVDLINGFNKSPYCFTLQSCYGHFVYNDQKDTHNLDPLLTKETIAKVEYKIV